MSRFIIGRDNLSLTIFVPWDCNNNCHFCTSKKEYQCDSLKYLNENMENIKYLIRKYNNTSIKEVVFTGGEPLSNLDLLKQLIDEVSDDKNVFINTTFPCPKGRWDAATIAEYINSENKIKGISISRHHDTFEKDVTMFSNNILKDRWISLIKKSVRINCVLNNHTNIENVILRYKSLPKNVIINFRADYKWLTEGNLKSFNEEGFKKIASIKNMEYKYSTGCDVCHTNVFEYSYDDKNIRNILYHRGIMNTAIRIQDGNGEKIIVNDIIIKPNGEIYYDWDFSKESSRNIMELHQMLKEEKERENDRKKTRLNKHSKGISLGNAVTSVCGFSSGSNC